MLDFLGYRQAITFQRFHATFQFTKQGWGKPKRKQIESTVPSKSA